MIQQPSSTNIVDRRAMLTAAGAIGLWIGGATSMNGAETKSADDRNDQLTLTPFLTFMGQASEAIKLYVGLFENSRVESIEYYGAEGPGAEGTVRMANVVVCGQRLRCLDSPVKHEWTFTPAISLFVETTEEAAIDRYYHQLSEQGVVLMPLNEYPFSKKFAWVQDRFGVTWQISFNR